jgi:hypothetical protein
MPASELTKCPKCGRMVPLTKCVCGYLVGWIRWNRESFELALKQGWRVLKCPPTPACPAGVSVLTHTDIACKHECCRYYPLKHWHRANNVEEVVLEEDKPGGERG